MTCFYGGDLKINIFGGFSYYRASIVKYSECNAKLFICGEIGFVVQKETDLLFFLNFMLLEIVLKAYTELIKTRLRL